MTRKCRHCQQLRFTHADGTLFDHLAPNQNMPADGVGPLEVWCPGSHTRDFDEPVVWEAFLEPSRQESIPVADPVRFAEIQLVVRSKDLCFRHPNGSLFRVEDGKLVKISESEVKTCATQPEVQATHSPANATSARPPVASNSAAPVQSPGCAEPGRRAPSDGPQDWTEDRGHENGRYLNTCHVCGRPFMGHKQRVTCKLCVADPLPESTPTLTDPIPQPSGPAKEELDSICSTIQWHYSHGDYTKAHAVLIAALKSHE